MWDNSLYGVFLQVKKKTIFCISLLRLRKFDYEKENIFAENYASPMCCIFVVFFGNSFTDFNWLSKILFLPFCWKLPFTKLMNHPLISYCTCVFVSVPILSLSSFLYREYSTTTRCSSVCIIMFLNTGHDRQVHRE